MPPESREALSDHSASDVIGPYDITFSLMSGASAEDAVWLHEQVKAHPYVVGSQMSVADFAGECDRLRAENEALKENLARMQEAGDRVTAENEALKAALRPFADAGRQAHGWLTPRPQDWAIASATLPPASDEQGQP